MTGENADAVRLWWYLLRIKLCWDNETAARWARKAETVCSRRSEWAEDCAGWRTNAEAYEKWAAQ